jgi:hypothetical protein
VFIGGTEAFSTGTWVWLSTLTQITATDWFPGKPDIGGTDFCVAMTYTTDYAWDDWFCHSSQFSFICEREII